MFDVADKNKPAIAKMLLYFSVVAVVLALIGATGNDIYLASTQWLLVAILLSAWGVYVLIEAHLRIRK